MATTVVIGIGNPYRRDDGAGIAVVRRLRLLVPQDVEVAECHGDLTTLLDIWQGYSRVIVIDAMRSGRIAGEVERFGPLDAHTPCKHALLFDARDGIERNPCSGTDTEPASTAKLVLYGIEGADFGEGEGLSEEVAKAVEDVVRYILLDLQKGEEDA
jgi:hydrogenase maturation protease